jgi:hypothetical protein
MTNSNQPPSYQQKVAEAREQAMGLMTSDPTIDLDQANFIDSHISDDDFRSLVYQFRSQPENQYRQHMKTAVEALIKNKKKLLKG